MYNKQLMKKITFLFSFLILSFLNLIIPDIARGQENLNKFGIHILNKEDLEKARELVNSSGGDWGWVTVVIRDDEQDKNYWQDFFDQCREKHLIPLVRIATHLEEDFWVKPKLKDAEKWADFLGDLNWPTKDQYVIVFNEPNHAKEWGGEIDPEEYAKILQNFISKFKVQSSNFKILNAGLDLAAPNSGQTMDAFLFLEKMNQEISGIFENLDAWVSHSYPNHGFLGKPWGKGRISIRGYEWELNILKNQFGVKKDLAVFITETGWPKRGNFYNEKTVASYFKYAFENVWLPDKRIMAITPFLLNYPQDLFDEFSWLDNEGKPYPQYESVKNIPKISWWPLQETKYKVLSVSLPPFLPANTNYYGKIKLKNTGQSIWGERKKLIIPGLKVEGITVSNLSIESSKIKPGESIILDFTIQSSSKSGNFIFSWENLPEYRLKVFPSSAITKTPYNLWFKIISKLNLFQRW